MEEKTTGTKILLMTPKGVKIVLALFVLISLLSTGRLVQFYYFNAGHGENTADNSLALDSLKIENEKLKGELQKLDAYIRFDGVYFVVQIGAFKKFDLGPYLKEWSAISGELIDEMNKYTIGKFKTYEEAKKFKADIKALGIKDAFIVGKIDGKRVDIKEAIQATSK